MPNDAHSYATPGRGHVHLQLHGDEAVFAKLAYKYPLKLLSPRVTQSNVSILYAMNYGGGLVGGDHIDLTVQIDDGARLLLLTQGSTKVFKTRPGRPPRTQDASNASDPSSGPSTTVQTLTTTLGPQSLLLLLPDPVTCFAQASYDQVQTFRLASDASAVLLDWLTAGRLSRGEEWDFTRYSSTNEVFISGKRVVRDVLLLEEEQAALPNLPPRTLQDRLRPYTCYATLILCGPLVQPIVDTLSSLYQDISVFQQSSPQQVLWSLTHVVEQACIIRVAGQESETIKFWLRDNLRGLEDVVGADVYAKAFVY